MPKKRIDLNITSLIVDHTFKGDSDLETNLHTVSINYDVIKDILVIENAPDELEEGEELYCFLDIADVDYDLFRAIINHTNIEREMKKFYKDRRYDYYEELRVFIVGVEFDFTYKDKSAHFQLKFSDDYDYYWWLDDKKQRLKRL